MTWKKKDAQKWKKLTCLEHVNNGFQVFEKKKSEQNTLLRPSHIFLINPIKYLLPSVLVGSYVLSNTFYISW